MEFCDILGSNIKKQAPLAGIVVPKLVLNQKSKFKSINI